MEKELVDTIREFIEEHDITCPETIFQSDNISLESLNLIETLCEIVGYKDNEDEI